MWAAGGAGGGAGGPGGCARAGAARRAVADADGPAARARAHQGGHPGTRASEAVSREEAASARCERQGRREASKQEAAEREAEAVGARPIRITTQVGLVAQRQLRDRGWTAARAEAEANEAAAVDVAAPATGAGSEGDAGVRVGDGAAPATGLGRSLGQGSQPQGGRQAAADHAGPEAAGWEEEAEVRRLWQREEAALY